MIQQNIAVTVDAIVAVKDENDDFFALMIRRKNDPFKGQLAFPGGFLEEGEDLMAGALRELEEETGLKLDKMNQWGAAGRPDRDPRGHTVSIVFTARIAEMVPVVGQDDAAEALWYPMSDRDEKLAFDHDWILFLALSDPRTWLGEPANVLR